jgi:hypothetical protein
MKEEFENRNLTNSEKIAKLAETKHFIMLRKKKKEQTQIKKETHQLIDKIIKKNFSPMKVGNPIISSKDARSITKE